MKKLSLYLFIGLVFTLTACSNPRSVTSPNGKLSLGVEQGDDGTFTYYFVAEGDSLIKNSLLGFISADDGAFPSADWDIVDLERKSQDTVWRPLWGKRALVEDRYNELIIKLINKNLKAGELDKLDIALRAYDDGIAFRYEVPRSSNQQEVTIARELTQFNFSDDYTAWFYNFENHNIGPEKLSETDGERYPVMTVKVNDRAFMSIHEAYLQTGMPMTLTSQQGETTFEVSSSPNQMGPGSESAWRVIFYGNTMGEIVDSHLLELLNPDPDPEADFSWVKPSVGLWDWRMNGAKVGYFTYSMSYPSWVKMVDFASENGLLYLILDANWYGPEFKTDSDPLVGDKASDVQRLIAYAKTKGVGIWLYLNDVGGRRYPIDQTLKQYGEWGAAGVKYGFMRADATEKVSRTQMITRLCAENKLLVNFHDKPVHPYGQMRTWPNALTREYCHAQLDGHHVFYPKTFVTSVFVNMVAGPLDMNNGMFDLRQGHTDRVDESQPVPSTLVSEAARTAIVFSGATIIPDIPEFYNKYPSLLRFISAQNKVWRESKTLSGEIGEHIVMMRETDEHYLVGAAINEAGGELEIPLSFLPKGRFRAELTTDGPGAHYLTNRECLEVESLDVDADLSLKVRLAPGGGACLLIKK